MKKTLTLLLSALVLGGMPTPAYCDEAPAAEMLPITDDMPSPIQDVFKRVNEMLTRFHRCESAILAVKDTATADRAADTIRQELNEFVRLREECVRIFAENPAIFPQETDVRAGEVLMSQFMVDLEHQLAGVYDPVQAKLEGLAGLDTPFYGSGKLASAARVFSDMMEWGMTPEESDLMPQVVPLYKEFHAVCREAWACLATVKDAASAEAARAELVKINARADEVNAKLKVLLDTLRQDRLIGFCGQGRRFALIEEGQESINSFLSGLSEAQGQVGILKLLDPPFYGAPELEGLAAPFLEEP